MPECDRSQVPCGWQQSRHTGVQPRDGYIPISTAESPSRPTWSTSLSRSPCRRRRNSRNCKVHLASTSSQWACWPIQAYGPKLIDCIMFAWMHVFLVNGLFHALTGLFPGDLHQNGWKHQDIHQFANTFTWPARVRGAAPKDILHKRASTTAALSCSVSEALNFLQVLRTYVVFWVLPTCNEDMRNACETWLSLCMVLDVLQKIGMGKIVPPVELQRLIQTTLDLAKARYGADSFWVPKCHLALHLPLQLSRHSCLLSCFVHERKHKIVKKISNQVLDTSRTFEKSILDDVLHGHVQHLAGPAFLPCEAGMHMYIFFPM